MSGVILDRLTSVAHLTLYGAEVNHPNWASSNFLPIDIWQEINGCSFKPPDFGIISYTAINANIQERKLKTGLLDEAVSLHWSSVIPTSWHSNPYIISSNILQELVYVAHRIWQRYGMWLLRLDQEIHCSFSLAFFLSLA